MVLLKTRIVCFDSSKQMWQLCFFFCVNQAAVVRRTMGLAFLGTPFLWKPAIESCENGYSLDEKKYRRLSFAGKRKNKSRNFFYSKMVVENLWGILSFLHHQAVVLYSEIAVNSYKIPWRHRLRKRLSLNKIIMWHCVT